MNPTLEQQELIDTISRLFAADADIEAAWLGGSLGRGSGDAFSDVDVLALVTTVPATTAGLRYGRDCDHIADAALVTVLFGGSVVSVVTTDWRRFDISFIERPDLARYAARHLRALFNKGDHTPSSLDEAPYLTTPATVLALVNEYLRVLGLLVVALGREEYLVGLAGVEILRRLTTDLMLEENGVGPAERGGALRRNPFLKPDQRRELAALAPVSASREGLIAANLELAAIFLPRAKRLAAQVGMAWPAVFEAATKRHLRERLGVAIV